jgi:hypothetical protein
MYRNIFYLQENVLKIKRRNEFLLFAPNLTMNLTYLCSGDVNVQEYFLFARKCAKNKKEERIPPFCPKSYHELNLLMFR